LRGLDLNQRPLGYESSSEPDFNELRGQERACKYFAVHFRHGNAPLSHPDNLVPSVEPSWSFKLIAYGQS
jgi:hypothetical protein